MRQAASWIFGVAFLALLAMPTLVAAQGSEPDDFGVPETTQTEIEDRQPETETVTEAVTATESETAVDSDDDVLLIIDDEPGGEIESGGESGDEVLVIIDDDDDEVLIIDDESDDDVLIIIDDRLDGDAEDHDAAPTPIGIALPTFGAGRTWMTIGLSSRFMIDSNFDTKTREDVVEWWNVGRLRLDHRAGPALRAIAEAWVRWGVVGEDTKPLNDFALFNARNPKWVGEVQLREGYVTLSGWGFDLKIGQRIFVWGKNEMGAPADVMNPIDLRYDALGSLTSTKDGKVPVFAVDLAYNIGDTALQLVVAPFFSSNAVFLFGRDFSLAAPGTPMRAQIQALGAVHPSIEDQLQQALSGTEMPDESFENMSVALRAKTSLFGWDFAATAYFGWDRTPQLDIDEDLAVVLARAAEIQEILINPNNLANDPELQATALRLQQRAAIGEELLSATFNRMWVFALEAEGAIGDVIVRADVGVSPQQTFYDSELNYHFLPTFTGALGAEYTRGEEWFAALTGILILAFDPPRDATLAGLEPVELDPAPRDVSALLGVAATGRYLWEWPNIQFQAAAIYAFIPSHVARVSVTNFPGGDLVLTGEIAYKDWEPHVFKIGGVYITGPEKTSGTIGQSLQRNDFLYVQYEGSW